MKKLSLIGLIFYCFSLGAMGNEAKKIHQMLDIFLAENYKKSQHDSFWAETLIYTSSSGTRFGKSEIMSGFANGDADKTATPIYSAHDVNIQMQGELALLTFKLKGKGGENTHFYQEYLNSGVLKMIDGRWQVIVWHATKVPKTQP